MSQSCYHLFDTAIGRCAIIWRGAKIAGVVLPENTDTLTLNRIDQRCNGAMASSPPTYIRRAIANITAVCSGQPADFSEAPLERAKIDDFASRVYEVTSKIPAGETRTYGDVARDLGGVSHSRAVGAALGANPFPIIIPCHRIIASDGALGGFSAPGGAQTKRRLLEIEGAFAADNLPLFRT